MLRKTTVTILGLILILAGRASAAADEGMFPISDIRKLDLKAKGLAIDPAEIYSMDNSLIFAISAQDQRRRPYTLYFNCLTTIHLALESLQAAQAAGIFDVFQHGVAKLRQLRQKRNVMSQTVCNSDVNIFIRQRTYLCYYPVFIHLNFLPFCFKLTGWILHQPI